MSFFGIGGSKSKQKAESTGFDVSRGVSESRGISTSEQGSQATQDIAFADLFGQLYGGAAAAAGKVQPGGLSKTANMLFSGGTDFLEQLQGGSAAAYLEKRLAGGEDSLLQENIAGLKTDLGTLFREELNPALREDAVASGTFGGGRQGVAQGIAAGKIAEQFQRGSTALRSADVAARDAAARDLYGLRTDAAKAGIGSLPGLLDIKQRGQLADLAPYQALASIFGGPTVLGESSSFGRSQSEDVAKQVSESFGFDTSKSTGKSKSFSFGF